MDEHPVTVGDWQALRGEHLATAQRQARWRAMPDDTIGGWCIMPDPRPPSTGIPAVGTFLSEPVAHHIVDLHNADLRARQYNEIARRRQAEQAAGEKSEARHLVKIGDLIHVPRGADPAFPGAFRILVESITSYGASGPRIKTDGTPMRSQTVLADRSDGNVGGVAAWAQIQKATIYRDGEVIYRPSVTGTTPRP